MDQHIKNFGKSYSENPITELQEKKYIQTALEKEQILDSIKKKLQIKYQTQINNVDKKSNSK